MIKPFIVHEGQVYINQALVAEGVVSQTNPECLAAQVANPEPEGLYSGLCVLEPIDPEALGREFRTDVMSILAEELRPGGLFWKHIPR